jgi:glutamate synthase domain-containing protein 3
MLKALIEDHHRWTGSLRAREILDHWVEARGKFVKVFPHEYKRALDKLSAERQSDATISKARGMPAGTVAAK